MDRLRLTMATFREPHRHGQPHDALGDGDAIAAQGIADHWHLVLASGDGPFVKRQG